MTEPDPLEERQIALGPERFAEMTAAQAADVERFLRTGEDDSPFDVWSIDGSTFRGLVRSGAAKRTALIAEVLRRRAGARHDCELPTVDLTNLARRKVTPMVTGLFRTSERETVLATLAKSLVFLTRDNIVTVLEGESFLRSAWDIANLYLDSIGVEMLGPHAVRVVGMSQETTCYVSPAYFTERDRFADFVVHEAAHVFHNCKRETLGLPFKRRQEWLLEIAYRKRETFAYACEAYSRILELGATKKDRLTLFAEYAGGSPAHEERVDVVELVDIVREAVGARNGWKRILARCAPTHPPRRPPPEGRGPRYDASDGVKLAT